MKLFPISCLIIAVACSSAVDADEKFELEAKEEPFPGLKRGAITDVIPNPSPDTPENRIVSGQYACKQQFPYQAGLLIGFEDNSYAWCGGTLIGNEWILTAAHCTSGAKTIEVRLGSVYSDSPLRIVWGYENHVHENWGRSGDDIALVKIQWVDYNHDIAPAALPARNGQYSQYVNSRAIASGWGSTNDAGQGSNELKYVLMTVMDKDACARVYGQNAKRASILCTNTRGFGSPCSGDSGGPLVLESTRVLIGVAAFGAASGCTHGMPAGFTRVTYYLDWINKISGISW